MNLNLKERLSPGETELLTVPSVLWLAFFLLVPVLFIVYYSFLGYSNYTVIQHLTLQSWNQNVFTADTVSTMVRTLGLGLGATVLTLVFGFPLAYYLRFHTSENGGILLLLFLVIPFWTSGILRAIAWIPVLGKTGVINKFLIWGGITHQPVGWLFYSLFAQLVGYLQNYLVFMAAPIYIALSRIDEELLSASGTLRADPIETFRHVTWPLSAPGVAIGTIFVFVLSIGNFTIPTFLSGGQGTITTLIYYLVNNSLNYPGAAALSITLLLVIMVIISLLLRRVDIIEIMEDI